MSTLKFPCGCTFPVEDGKDGIIEQDPMQPMPLGVKIDMFNINPDCPATWDLLSSGRTKGVFQLEAQLGKTWSKKVEPSNLEDLGALVSLLRPGCLRSVSDTAVKWDASPPLTIFNEQEEMRIFHPEPGERYEVENYRHNKKKDTLTMWFDEDSPLHGKIVVDPETCHFYPPKSMTQHYADRKRGLEDVDYFGVAELKPILSNTYCILVYQEQAMKIAVAFAGFNKQEADVLRKAIGKKKADIMAEVKDKFMAGCEEVGIVTTEQAEMIFGWIQESQRYSFNKCLCPTTLVLTYDGFKTLDEVAIGDYVNSPSGYTEVVNKYENGERELFEITLGSGLRIKCTLDHEFLCGDGEKHKLWEIISDGLCIVCNFVYASLLNDHELPEDPDIPYAEKIATITRVGISRTVDIEVSNDDHIFYGNGIATANSHAVSYGQGSYWSAFCKAHAPVQFFCSYLRGANWKQDRYEEITQLVSDAQTFDIDVRVPDFRDLRKNFSIKGVDIYFGLSSVRGIGASALDKIERSAIESARILQKSIQEWTWMDYLIYFSDRVSSTVTKSLINSGALDYLGIGRKRMMHEFDCYANLTKKEQEWVYDQQYENFTMTDPKWDKLSMMIGAASHTKKEGGACHNTKRVSKLESIFGILVNPPSSLDDTAHFIATNEERYLGLPLTCTEVDGCVGASDADATCLDILNGLSGQHSVAVTINRIKEIKTKEKKELMAFMTVSDSSCSLEDVVVFPSYWKEHSDRLYMGNTILLMGERDRNRGGFIVKNVWQI